MFYLLKHFLLLNLVIFKLKCNNLIFNEILALYVCLMYSRFVENHLICILEDWTPHFWGGSVTGLQKCLFILLVYEVIQFEVENLNSVMLC
jgi:hypothetical protein